MAGDRWMSSLFSTVTLAGTSASRSSPRVAVTVTCCDTLPGTSTTSSGEPAAAAVTDCVFSANPPARIVRSNGAGSEMVNRPSRPVTVRCSAPDGARAMTVAPDTAPPELSRTTPVTEAAD